MKNAPATTPGQRRGIGSAEDASEEVDEHSEELQQELEGIARLHFPAALGGHFRAAGVAAAVTVIVGVPRGRGVVGNVYLVFVFSDIIQHIMVYWVS